MQYSAVISLDKAYQLIGLNRVVLQHCIQSSGHKPVNRMPLWPSAIERRDITYHATDWHRSD